MVTGIETVAGDGAAVRAAFGRLADRGAFRSFDAVAGKGGNLSFRFRWLRDQEFSIGFDARRRLLKVVSLFADAPNDPPMAKNLRKFIDQLAAEERPIHRRLESSRLQLIVSTVRQDIQLSLTIHDPDAGWAVEQLITVLNEIYMMFLSDPIYYDYRVKTLGAHPDWG